MFKCEAMKLIVRKRRQELAPPPGVGAHNHAGTFVSCDRSLRYQLCERFVRAQENGLKPANALVIHSGKHDDQPATGLQLNGSEGKESLPVLGGLAFERLSRSPCGNAWNKVAWNSRRIPAQPHRRI